MAVVINGNGTVTGVTAQDELNVDSNTLVVDSTNDRVGIGTTSPDNVLHIKADAPIIKLEDNQAGGSYHQLSNSNSDGTLVMYADAGGTKSSTANMRFSVSGSEAMRITSDGRGVSDFIVTAWVNFQGSGTVTIRDSYYVSSITDDATGNYTVNFTSDLSNVNYSVGMTAGNNANDDRIPCMKTPGSVSSFNFQIRNLQATIYDADYVGVQVFGGQ